MALPTCWAASPIPLYLVHRFKHVFGELGEFMVKSLNSLSFLMKNTFSVLGDAQGHG
jgi:hypothetical protein